MAVDAFLTVEKFGGSSASIALLRSILSSAANPNRTTPVRIAADGDSQETSPGGEGWQWLNALNYYFWQKYGNSPESQVMPVGSYGGGSPAAGWLAAGSTGGFGIAGLAATNRYPYNLEPSVNNRYTWDNVEFGSLCMLQAAATTINAGQSFIPRTTEYLSRTGLKCNVMLPNLNGQQPTQFRRRCIRAPSASPTYYGGTSISTASINIPSINRTQDTGFTIVQFDYDFGANPPTSGNLLTEYPQFTCYAVDAGTRLEVAANWYTSGNKSGVTVSSFSAGGKLTTSQLTDRPNCLQFFEAIAPDIIMFTCGANDQGSRTAAQYQADLEAKVAAYAAVLPNTLFVLAADPDRTTVTSRSEWDEYPGAARTAALNSALAGYKCVHINHRRIMYESYGWDYRDARMNSLYLSDNVHYTALGGQYLALEDSKIMLSVLNNEAISIRVDGLGLNLKR